MNQLLLIPFSVVSNQVLTGSNAHESSKPQIILKNPVVHPGVADFLVLEILCGINRSYGVKNCIKLKLLRSISPGLDCQGLLKGLLSSLNCGMLNMG